MYNLQTQIQEKHNSKITQEQLAQVKEIDEYLAKNRVHQMLNEALAKLIETRPQKVKEGLVKIFQAMKENQTYFRKSDFQHMFQSYDFFEAKGGNQIPFMNLVQALDKINIKYSREQFLEKYPQFKLDRLVKKIDFINIMETEYKKKIKG